MVVDVVDIRKRIQKVRNDVSDSVLERRFPEPAAEQINAETSLEFVPGTDAGVTEQLQPSLPLDTEEQDRKIPLATQQAHRAVAHAMSMPSFNLNVTNKHSSRLLMTLITLQLITNLILVAVLIFK